MGSGTYVSKILPDALLQVPRETGAQPRTERYRTEQKGRRHLSDYGRRVTPFPVLEARPSRAFRVNLPALDLFPATLWAQITARRLRRVSTNLLRGCDPLGYPPLRDAVAGYLSTSRGVKCAPEQVMIVSGVQEALDLVARLFLNPGDQVAMEDPGYVGAALVFEAARAKISAMPLDGEGMELREPGLRGARLVYVTPAHQFPLGITMSLPRRLALLDWARKSDALIFEDDYDGEYRYSGRPVPALQGLDRDGLVLFAGSFSKVLFPSLRLGYLVIPPDLVAVLRDREVGDQPARAAAGAGGAVRLHRRGSLRAPPPAHAGGVRVAVVGAPGGRPGTAGGIAGDPGRGGRVADRGLALWRHRRRVGRAGRRRRGTWR